MRRDPRNPVHSPTAMDVYAPHLMGNPAAPARSAVITTGLAHPEEFPDEVQDFFKVPVAELNKATDGIVRVHTESDLTTLDDAQRALVRNPNTADACQIARTQVRAVQVETELANPADGGVDTALVAELVNKHEALQAGATECAEILVRTGQARDIILADRALAREDLYKHLVDELLAMAPDDPRRPAYQAAKDYIDAAENKARSKGQQAVDTQAATRDAALGRLQDAKQELSFAEVVHYLKGGVQPDPEALLQAARYLKQRLQEAGQLDETPPAPAPAATPATKKGQRTQKR